MNVEIGRDARVDGLEESQELLAAMPSMTLADDDAGRDVEGGKQRGGPMPTVIMRPSLG